MADQSDASGVLIDESTIKSLTEEIEVAEKLATDLDKDIAKQNALREKHRGLTAKVANRIQQVKASRTSLQAAQVSRPTDTSIRS